MVLSQAVVPDNLYEGVMKEFEFAQGDFDSGYYDGRFRNLVRDLDFDFECVKAQKIAYTMGLILGALRQLKARIEEVHRNSGGSYD